MILTMQLFFYMIIIMLRDPCGSTSLLLVNKKQPRYVIHIFIVLMMHFCIVCTFKF